MIFSHLKGSFYSLESDYLLPCLEEMQKGEANMNDPYVTEENLRAWMLVLNETEEKLDQILNDTCDLKERLREEDACILHNREDFQKNLQGISSRIVCTLEELRKVQDEFIVSAYRAGIDLLVDEK